MQEILEFKRAMRRQRFEEAESLLGKLPEQLPRDVSESVGLLHLIHSRWQQAAGVLKKLDDLTEDMAALSRYAGNMAVLEAHRPDLFKAIVELSEAEVYEVVREEVPRPTLCRAGTNQLVTSDASTVVEQAAVQAMAAAEAGTTRPASLMLLGIGDGYSLKTLLSRPPNNPFGALATLHVVEPDLHLFKACLLLHDWSAEDGPLAARRVVLSIGADWQAQWTLMLTKELGCPLPTQMLRLGVANQAVVDGIQTVVDRINQETTAAMHRVEARGQALTDLQVAGALSGGLGRSPRILWLTSRFSKVVRYSAADAAAGLEQIGVNTRLVMEQEDHHQITSRFLLHALESFEPDAVMMINYMRSQFQNGLPASLPVFTWLQDEIGELLSDQAGQAVDRRQFIGTCSPGFYSQQYDYPSSQMMYLNKLTRFPTQAVKVDPEPVVVFVSNAARTETQLMDDLLCRCGEGKAALDMIASCCEWLFELYRSGGCCQVAKELLPVIERAVKDHGLAPLKASECSRLAMLLFNSVNNTLYRQQGLRWARKCAEALGLELALYGQDWDKNPEFQDCNRGYAAYGPELEAITQKARFNLQIVPFNCMHQRLMDGWAAGGFYLIRDHPADRLNETWQRLFEQRPSGAHDTQAWREALSEDQRQLLDRAIADRARLMMDAEGDVLENSQAVCHDGYVPGSSLPPMMAEVTFDAEASLLERMRFFMDNPGAQDHVLAEQQAFLKYKGLRYSDGMRRVMEKMVRELAV